jgi:hypothetical protein
LQGAVLTSSDRGGIRIQYSKNPFGKKRDYGSFNDQSPYSPSVAAAPYDPSAAYQVSTLQFVTYAMYYYTCTMAVAAV